MKKNYIMPLLFAVGSFASYGQVAKQLKSTTPTAFGQFGKSVVNSNQHTLVGAPTEGQGAIYMYKDGNYVAKYTFDKAGDDNSALGTSVGLNSNWYGAGVPNRNFVESLGETGFAILGRRDQIGAGLNYYIFPSDLQAFNRFGESMAMSENWLAVGAPGQNDSKGTVYLYKQWQSNGNRGWDAKGKIVLPSLPIGAGFGSSVSIFENNGSSDRLIVGAPFHSNGGRIFVFKRSGDNWNLEFEYSPNLPQQIGFGSAVDITQNVLIAGAPFTGNNGFATILKYENNAWVVKHQYHGFTSGSRFGHSVAIQYNRAVIGAPTQGTTGELHLYNDQGGYQHKGTLYNGQTGGEMLGFSADIEADWIVSGAITANINGVSTAGAAYRLEFWKALQSASWRTASTVDAEVASEALYPNPATEGKVYHGIAAGVLQVKAISALGTSIELGFDANSIDVSSLSSGVYTLNITTEEGTKIQKLAVK